MKEGKWYLVVGSERLTFLSVFSLIVFRRLNKKKKNLL